MKKKISILGATGSIGISALSIVDKKKFIYNESHELILNSLDDLKIEYWIKQWLLTYEWILRIFSKKDKKINNIKLVCYEDLFKDENYKSIFFDYKGMV